MVPLARRGENKTPSPERSALSGLADGDCVLLARGGSRDAQAELVERHLPMIYNLAHKLARTPEDAADAAQEVFLRAFSALDAFDVERSFRSWLCAIAWNYVRDLGRRAKHRRARSLNEDEGGLEPFDRRSPSPLESASVEERRLRVREALEELEPQAKAILVLRDLEGMSYEDIAASFGCSLGTVKSRLHRARMGLKERLQAAGGDWAAEVAT